MKEIDEPFNGKRHMKESQILGAQSHLRVILFHHAFFSSDFFFVFSFSCNCASTGNFLSNKNRRRTMEKDRRSLGSKGEGEG